MPFLSTYARLHLNKEESSRLFKVGIGLLSENDWLRNRLDHLEYLDRQETNRMKDNSDFFHQSK